MSEGLQWYVSVEGQQHGPYSGEQLVEFTGTGNITRESMVWTEGMAEWLPAAQIEGLFPAAAPAPAAAPVLVRSATPTANFMRPGQATGQLSSLLSGQSTVQANPNGFPHPPIQAASFGLYCWFMGIGLAMPALLVFLISLTGDREEVPLALPLIILGLWIIGGICSIIGAILGYIILHRAWKCLSYAGATVTPGSAVGFLFIPFFNLYWIFRAFAGFAKEWNLITSAYEDTRLAPKMSEGMFLTFCICVVSMIGAPIAVILAFPVFSSMCRAINFIAFRPVQQPGTMRFR
jgi:hypothetical protein